MKVPTISRRFRPRFSLRALFILTTLCALWLGWNFSLVHERKEFYRVHSFGLGNGLIPLTATTLPQQQLPWLWSLVGVHPIHHIHISTAWLSPSEIAHVRALFPEAYAIVDGQLVP